MMDGREEDRIAAITFGALGMIFGFIGMIAGIAALVISMH